MIPRAVMGYIGKWMIREIAFRPLSERQSVDAKVWMSPYDPAIPLPGIHTEETRIERDTCTPMFIAALFTIARTWKQPRCPSAAEWIRKL